MAYASWSVVFGEQPSAAKWNILGTNDSYFDGYIDRSGFPIQAKFNSTTAVATGTTLIPNDDTIPQSSEGDQYMSQAITPTSTSNLLVVDVLADLANTVSNDIIGAIFQDATANALAAGEAYQVTANGGVMLHLRHTMAAGTTSSTTFKFRAGGSTAGTMTFNGASSTRRFGAITKSTMMVTEYRI